MRLKHAGGEKEYTSYCAVSLVLQGTWQFLLMDHSGMNSSMRAAPGGGAKSWTPGERQGEVHEGSKQKR
jgi:hypothetical protein